MKDMWPIFKTEMFFCQSKVFLRLRSQDAGFFENGEKCDG